MNALSGLQVEYTLSYFQSMAALSIAVGLRIDASYECMYLIAVLTISKDFTVIKKELLEKAYILLQIAFDNEKDHIKRLGAADQGLAVKIIGRRKGSITLSCNTENLGYAYGRVLCAEVGSILTQDCIKVLGSGHIFQLKKDSRTFEVTLNGLVEGVVYSAVFEFYRSDSTNADALSPKICFSGSVPVLLELLQAKITHLAILGGMWPLVDISLKSLTGSFIECLQVEENLINPLMSYSYAEKLFKIKSCVARMPHDLIELFCTNLYLLYDQSPDSNRNSSAINRLQKCVNMLIAAKCSKIIVNPEMELKGLFRAYDQLRPFLEYGVALPIVTSALLLCHQSILELNIEQSKWEEVIDNYFLPISYHLIKRFCVRAPRNGLLASQIYSKSITLIESKYPCKFDGKISSSVLNEQKMLGKVKPAAPLTEKCSRSWCISEFGFHAKLSLGDGRIGLLDERLSIHYYAEVANAILVKYTDHNSITRSLDQRVTLKEINLFFLEQGPELYYIT